MKNIIGQKQQEQYGRDSVGVEVVDMVGVPLVDQLVEALVFDAPASMSDAYDGVRVGFVLGKAGCPEPFAG